MQTSRGDQREGRRDDQQDEHRDFHGELAKRVEKLERQNRFWRIGGIAAIAALAFSLTAGAWAQEHVLPHGAERTLHAPVVEAEHFVLKSADGQTEGEFTITRQGPVLEIFGPGGRVVWSTRGGARPAGD